MDPPKPTPEQEFRRKTIADGEWTPIPVSELDDMLRDLVRRGEEFPEWAARLDLRYWADKGSIKAVTYYQKRWKWKGRQRTYDLLKEFGLKGQDSGKTRERFENESRTKKERFENDNPGESPGIEEVENESRTKKERFENDSRTVYPEAYSEEEKESTRETDGIAAWSEESIPVVRAWVEWHGRDTLTPAIQRTIQLLMMPAGSGKGAWLSDDPTGTKYDGYSVEEIIVGIEAMAKRNHHSADSLIRHVAGIMPAAGDKHGKAHRGASEQAGARATTDYQRRREYSAKPFEPEDFSGLAESLRSIKYGDSDGPEDH